MGKGSCCKKGKILKCDRFLHNQTKDFEIHHNQPRLIFAV